MIATATASTGRTEEERRFSGRAVTAGACPAPLFVPDHCRWSIRSRADCQRFAGSFSRLLRIAKSSAGTSMFWIVETGGGVDVMMAEINEAWLSLANAFLPVSI